MSITPGGAEPQSTPALTQPQVSQTQPAQPQLIQRYDHAVMNTFGPPKRVFVRGEGVHLWDADGNRYLDLLADARHPVGHLLGGVHHPLARLFGVADQSGRAADQQNRTVPGALQCPGQHDLHQVAHVNARGRRIEPDVEGDRPFGEVGAQGVRIGGVGDQPSPGQFVEHIGHAAQA